MIHQLAKFKPFSFFYAVGVELLLMLGLGRIFHQISMLVETRRQVSSVGVIRRTLGVYAVVFIVWGLYRLLLPFPLVVEEFVVKPLVYLPPLILVVRREGFKGKSIFSVFGFRSSGLFVSVYLGMSLGFAYLLVAVMGRLVFSEGAVVRPLTPSSLSLFSLTIVSLATAVWEQIVFSGFMLQRFFGVLRDEWMSSGVTAFLFMLLHLPILWLEFSSQSLFIVVQLLVLFLVGFGNSVLMLRTRNVIAPILSHAFWALSLGLLG